MKKMYIFNGKFSNELPQIPLNRSTYFGESFFTSFLVKNSFVLNVNAHLLRLQSSLDLFYPNLEKIDKDNVLNLLKRHIPKEGSFKVRITCFTNFEMNELNSLIEISALNKNNPSPIKAITKKFGHYDELDCTNIKLGQYAWENFYLRSNPHYDILRLSEDDSIRDLTKSNIIFFNGQEFVLPLANVLQGSSLKMFKELQGQKIIERVVYYDELAEFEAAYSINAVRLIQSISQIDEIKFSIKDSDEFIKTFKKYVDKVSKEL